jgi:TolB-like protein
LRYFFEEYAFDTDCRELHRGADVVSIAPQVFDLLEYLIHNRERVVSKDDLIKAIWNGRSVSDAALTTRLNAARTAIGDSGEEQRFIKTLPRKGFRFVGQVREAREVAGPNPGDAPESAPAVPDKPSIAVLPFANMSGDPEQEYFADGMVEEITTAFSRFKWLFVIARNSSFTFKGKAVDIKEVGRRLGVRYVLQGAVRKASGKVRITGQLVDAVCRRRHGRGCLTAPRWGVSPAPGILPTQSYSPAARNLTSLPVSKSWSMAAFRSRRASQPIGVPHVANWPVQDASFDQPGLSLESNH